MNTLIKNGRIVSHDNELTTVDIWIKEGKIHAIGESFNAETFEQVIDAKGQFITPGLVDVHVHLYFLYSSYEACKMLYYSDICKPAKNFIT